MLKNGTSAATGGYGGATSYHGRRDYSSSDERNPRTRASARRSRSRGGGERATVPPPFRGGVYRRSFAVWASRAARPVVRSARDCSESENGGFRVAATTQGPQWVSRVSRPAAPSWFSSIGKRHVRGGGRGARYLPARRPSTTTSKMGFGSRRKQKTSPGKSTRM